MIKCMLMLTNSGNFYSIWINLISYHPTEINATAASQCMSLIISLFQHILCECVSSEYIRCSCGSVLEHCVSSTKCCGFNSQGTQILIKIKCVSWVHCNLLWIKVFDIYNNIIHHPSLPKRLDTTGLLYTSGQPSMCKMICRQRF